eukprot:gene23092-10204_t
MGDGAAHSNSNSKQGAHIDPGSREGAPSFAHPSPEALGPMQAQPGNTSEAREQASKKSEAHAPNINEKGVTGVSEGFGEAGQSKERQKERRKKRKKAWKARKKAAAAAQPKAPVAPLTHHDAPAAPPAAPAAQRPYSFDIRALPQSSLQAAGRENEHNEHTAQREEEAHCVGNEEEEQPAAPVAGHNMMMAPADEQPTGKVDDTSPSDVPKREPQREPQQGRKPVDEPGVICRVCAAHRPRTAFSGRELRN